MKRIITLLLFLSIGVSFSVGNAIPFRDKIVDLHSRDGVYHIGSSAVGYGGAPHPFYLLALTIAEEGSEEEFRSMLSDSNPAVRAMGIVCLAMNEKEYPLLIGDNAEIVVFPGGCVGYHTTLFEFSRAFKKTESYRNSFIREMDDAMLQLFRWPPPPSFLEFTGQRKDTEDFEFINPIDTPIFFKNEEINP